MPVAGIRKVTVSQNGISGFVMACKKMDFHYCDFWGSSRGLNKFIKQHLYRFASANPQIEIAISPRPSKHPVITAHYINGRHKAICVRNLSEREILQKVELLRDANGEKLKRVTKPVQSILESVRGVWSPYHGKGMSV